MTEFTCCSVNVLLQYPSNFFNFAASLSDKFLAALSSTASLFAALGSLGAAAATFLTVREMKAGRVSAARARLTSTGTERLFTFEWRIIPFNEAPSAPAQRVIVRNASQGVARNIAVTWSAESEITVINVSLMQSIVGSGQSIRLAEGGYSAEFCDNGIVTSALVVSGVDKSYLGDLGPTQESFLPVPVTIMNYAFLKWLALLPQLRDGKVVAYGDVPTFKLSFSHDSPYEKCLKDDHVVRFEMDELRFFDEQDEALNGVPRGVWQLMNMKLRMEFVSRELQIMPTISL